MSKLKYEVNYDLALYNYKTKTYESKVASYSTLREARANQWKCEKCRFRVETFKKLALHKIEYHSY
jgi:hypothetical protein